MACHLLVCKIRQHYLFSSFKHQLYFVIRFDSLCGRSGSTSIMFANHGHSSSSRSRSKHIHTKTTEGSFSIDLDLPVSRERSKWKSRNLYLFRSRSNNVSKSPSSLMSILSRTVFTSSAQFSNTRASKESRTCWKCGGDTRPSHELFFCECGVVQKPSQELTFFDLLQLKQSFDLDLKRLGQLYRDTQNRLHPDKFSKKSQEEQTFAEEQSALLNKAYDTLRKPLSRANYMLQLSNIDIGENDSHSDPTFLMDIMTFNERVSTASSPEDIDRLYEMNEEKVDDCVRRISECFQDDNVSGARGFTIKLRYYTSIQDRIKELKLKHLDLKEK